MTHGPEGWIAVGNTTSGGIEHPLAMTSADGLSWRPADSPAAFTGPGSCVTAAAAGQHGYAVVGTHVSGARVYAATWRTADRRRWGQGDNDRFGFLDGAQAKSVADAVAATPGGFVAAGTHALAASSGPRRTAGSGP